MSYILTACQTVQQAGTRSKSEIYLARGRAKDGEIEPVRKIPSLGPRHLSVPNSVVLKSNGFDVPGVQQPDLNTDRQIMGFIYTVGQEKHATLVLVKTMANVHLFELSSKFVTRRFSYFSLHLHYHK